MVKCVFSSLFIKEQIVECRLFWYQKIQLFICSKYTSAFIGTLDTDPCLFSSRRGFEDVSCSWCSRRKGRKGCRKGSDVPALMPRPLAEMLSLKRSHLLKVSGGRLAFGVLRRHRQLTCRKILTIQYCVCVCFDTRRFVGVGSGGQAAIRRLWRAQPVLSHSMTVKSLKIL